MPLLVKKAELYQKPKKRSKPRPKPKLFDGEMEIAVGPKTSMLTNAPRSGVAFGVLDMASKEIRETQDCKERIVARVKDLIRELRWSSAQSKRRIGIAIYVNHRLKDSIPTCLKRIKHLLGLFEETFQFDSTKLLKVSNNPRISVLAPGSQWLSHPTLFSLFLLIVRGSLIYRLKALPKTTEDFLVEVSSIDEFPYSSICKVNRMVPVSLTEIPQQFLEASTAVGVMEEHGIWKVLRKNFKESWGAIRWGTNMEYAGICAIGHGLFLDQENFEENNAEGDFGSAVERLRHILSVPVYTKYRQELRKADGTDVVVPLGRLV